MLTRIIYEDGSIGYSNSDLVTNDKSGPDGAVPVAHVDSLNVSPEEAHRMMVDSRFQKAERKGKNWKLRDKSTQEQVDEGILSPDEAQRKERSKKGKDSV
jgi:hypothetical protein